MARPRDDEPLVQVENFQGRGVVGVYKISVTGSINISVRYGNTCMRGGLDALLLEYLSIVRERIVHV